jgi:pyruvate formate-lyase/glycerol dehydratase family glycyl radical enzyme
MQTPERAEAGTATLPERADVPRRLSEAPVLPRLARLRADLRRAPYHLCTQKASLITRYFRQAAPSRPLLRPLEALHWRTYAHALEQLTRGVPAPRWAARLNTGIMRLYQKLDGLSPARMLVEHARALQFLLANVELRVYDGELIVGNLTSQRNGAPLHPDYGGLLMLPELEGLSRRRNNPLGATAEQIRELREEVFPYWFRRSVLGLTPLYASDPALLDTVTEGSRFVLTQFAGLAHVTPDFPSVLRLGLRGIAERLRERQAALEAEIAAAPADRSAAGLSERAAFCEAASLAAEAACAHGRRWRDHLRLEAGREPDPARGQELRELAEIFERVPAEPARTFHEALQSVFLTFAVVHQESFQHGISFGRLDQFLLPYYRSDVEAGRLSPQRAIELLGCFLGKASEIAPLFFDRATEYFSGLSSAPGITLGGQAEDGSDATNEVSRLVLLAYDQMRLRQPNLHVRVHEGTDAQFLELCAEIVRKGGGMPAFFNDGRIVEALRISGVASADARNYSIVGCTEWGPPGCMFPAAGAGFVNLPYALLLALRDGRDAEIQAGPRTGRPAELGSMTALLDALRLQVRHLVAQAAEGNDAIETVHARHRPTPFLSSLIQGCLESGRDVTAGGAIYNPTGLQGVGLADVADSLAAIERVVFGERRIALEQLVHVLDEDFARDEPLRVFLRNRIPKFGQDDPDADRWAERVSHLWAEEVRRFGNPRGGRYSPGLWSMTTHQGFGRATGALPSGRRAGEPLANGMSACAGAERRGPTASLASAACVAPMSNGAVYNQKLQPELLAGEAGKGLLAGLVRGYFRKGGMQVQLNVLDGAVLLEAKAHPEKHPDLIVRISGYSAYFNDLTEAMKDEIIARTLHGEGCH